MRFWPGFGYGHSALAQIRFRPKHYTKTAETVKLARTVTLTSLAIRLLAVGGQGGAYASWYRRPET